MYGHEDMINYLSDYRTQDRMKGVHYYPKGLLCWFETNQYGDPIGSVYVIKPIPDMVYLQTPRRKRGFRQVLSDKIVPLNKLLSRTNEHESTIPVVKPKLHKYMKGEK